MSRPIQTLALALLSTAALTAPVARAATPAKTAPAAKAGPFDAELDAWEKNDAVKDPKGDMAKLIELQKRILANPAAGKAAQARVLGAMGASAFYMQDFARAAELMEQSSAIWEAMGNQVERMSEMENNRAAILRAMGKLADAEVAAKKAVEMRRRIYPDPSTEIGMAIYNLGSIYMSMGRFEEAAPLMREAARHQEQAGGDNAAAMVTRLSGLGSALNEAGLQDEAVAVARRAVQIAGEKLGDSHQLTSVALNNLGTNLNDAGRFQEAIPVLREALRVRVKTLGENHAWTAYSLRNLAFALEGSGKLDESQALNEQALAIFKNSPETTESWALSRLYGALALTASVRQDWDRYDRYITEAIDAADRRLAETSSDRAYTHVFHASVLTQRGRLAEALPIAEKWVPVITAAMNPAHRDRIWAELLLARLRLWKGDSAAALPLADAAVAQLTKKLSSFGVGDRQLVREAEMNHKSALLLLDLAIAAKDEERTFAALQLATISDLALGQQFNRDGAGGSGPAIEARRAVLALARREAELGGRQARAVQTRDPAAPQLAKDLAEIRTWRDAAEADLRARFPEFAARYRPSPVSLATVRSRLAKDQVLVIIAEGPLQSQAVAFTAKGMDVATFDTAPALKLANRLREAVDGPASDLSTFPYADAHALYRMIMPKQAQKARQLLLHGGRELASLPLGMLTTRPFGGKLPGAPWLARQASVRVIGNLALFNRGVSPPAAPVPALASAASRMVVGIGGPDLPGSGKAFQLAGLFRSGQPDIKALSDLPPLPDAAAELQAIARAFPGSTGTVLIGREAWEEKVKAANLADARILAFATHGLVAGEMRGLWEPALLLGTSGPDSGEDGLLGASEIARLRLGAELVILSACNTGAGDGAGGPVYSGLATAFAEAGAGSLLLSHWRVRDDAAARLSVETVRQRAGGKPTAEALRQAELALMADKSVPNAAHPAIWAPFVVVEN